MSDRHLYGGAIQVHGVPSEQVRELLDALDLHGAEELTLLQRVKRITEHACYRAWQDGKSGETFMLRASDELWRTR